jgi:hypothetical protein
MMVAGYSFGRPCDAARGDCRRPPRAQPIGGLFAAPGTRTLALQRTLGNQTVLRMTSPSANSADAGDALLQRQDAPAADTTPGQTAPPAVTSGPGSGGTPAGGGPATQWSTSLLDASIEDSNNPQCLGTVRAGGGLLFSNKCGNISGPFCQAAGVTFSVDFTVDAVNGPRPAGFTAPTVRVQLIFVNSGGSTAQKIDKQDTKPRYVTAGTPLEPAFGHAFPFSTMESGWLHIHLQLMDPDTSTTIDYNDRVTFTVTPCM